jgi:transcriptional regulator with XRE-family HTH domain
MLDPDLKTTLREFHEYFARSYEAPHTIAERIGVAKVTIWDWFAGRCQPKAKSLVKLRRFLDAEAKRPAQGDGIKPIERVPFKIVKRVQQLRYARLCPFCRKARGKIQSTGRKRLQGVCPKCGASGTQAGESSGRA